MSAGKIESETIELRKIENPGPREPGFCFLIKNFWLQTFQSAGACEALLRAFKGYSSPATCCASLLSMDSSVATGSLL
jgi:hypothetical protein